MKITINPQKTLKQLIADGKYNTKYINVDYELLPAIKATVDVELVQVGFQENNEAVISALGKKGYRLATFREMLTLCAKYPELQNDKDIASIDGDFHIAFGRGDDGRDVDVGRSDGDWRAAWWFGVVKKDENMTVRKSSETGELGTLEERLLVLENEMKKLKEIIKF